MRIFRHRLAALLLMGGVLFGQAAVQEKPASVALVPASLLPKVFAGWVQQPDAKAGTSPAQADPKNADIFKESGFTDFASARYTQAGREIKVQAFRFTDGTGAYAAYTLLRPEDLAPERFCEKNGNSGSAGSEVFIQCTNVLLHVELDKVTAMTAAQMRSLVAAIPKLEGNSGAPPNLPAQLAENLRPGVRYALGTAGYARTASPVAAGLIDFGRNPEIVVAHFRALDGQATAVLLSYPTPNIAKQELQRLDEFARTRTHAAAGLDTFLTKRTGPIVAVVVGEIAEGEAREMLARVNYDANLSWTEATGLEPKNNVANLLVNVIYLCFIVVGFTLVGGVAFGGIRVLSRRYFPGRFGDRPENAEIIRLKLND